MKKQLLLAAATLIFSSSLLSQGVTVGAAGSADASAILDVKSTSKGMLVPRLTKQQRGLIQNPANGLMIYQLDDVKGFWYYDQPAAKWMQPGDNLGNHTLTENLTTGSKWLSKNGNSIGIQLTDDYGGVAIRGYCPDEGAMHIPHHLFQFDNSGGFVSVTGGIGLGTIPYSGPGLRMMWYPFKGAFRAAEATPAGLEMDDQNIGFYSWAGGSGCLASSLYSFAFGSDSKATSTGSVSFGVQNKVSGPAGFSAGTQNTVSGTYAVGMGYKCYAGGKGAVALGYESHARNYYSVALGFHASSSVYQGTMAMGDYSSSDSVLNTAHNQFVARYAGGYRFYSNPTKTIGVSVAAGGNSWTSISDSSKKENFLRADGEDFLTKLRGLKLGSWNYKGQPESGYRHYGPMAQEIFAAYGKDAFGTIGCDTLLATADMDGIAMVLLQALEKRSSEQLTVNENLLAANNKMGEKLATLEDENKALQEKLAKVELMQRQILALQQALDKKDIAGGQR